MRQKLLKHILKKCPEGDLTSYSKTQYAISCVFIFYQRYHLMDNILHCLNSQSMAKDKFHIVLVEDKGGSEKGAALNQKFSDLNISYYAPEKGWGKMGYMRNFGLSKAKGEIILFLDDDTVIDDTRFLEKLCAMFRADHSLQAVIPRGHASFSTIDRKYAFHDPFFFTNRCMAYRKKCLIDLGGFDSNFIGQEDVELSIRFMAKHYPYIQTHDLYYYHPPMIFHNSAKGYAVGASFAGSKYSLFIKCLLLINGSRWLPLYFMPGLKNRFMARFAVGFLKGFIQTLFNKKRKADYL